MTLGVYIIARNEEDLIGGCIELVKPFADELLLVNHGSTDRTRDIMAKYTSNILDIPYSEPVDMGAVRTQCYANMTSDFVLAVDADEYYPEDTMRTIRSFVNNPGDAISARVKYKNLSWRSGYVQEEFNHFPDRLYKRECVEAVRGVLPDDMTFVKREYLFAPNKQKGSVGVLEYDNDNDESFVHPKQPILDATYFHLARTRGFNFETEKWKKYNQNLHPNATNEDIEKMTRINQWVTGLYPMDKLIIPNNIPTQSIKEPKVSIIITNYNYGQFVKNAIESARNQTVKPHEIIVVDDCSTDNSSEIYKEFDDITVLQQLSNNGVVQARNWGISHSTGDFFILLDADDCIEPTYIEKVLQKQKETEAEVVFTDMYVFGDIEYFHTYPEFSLDELKRNQCIPSVCALIKRQVFDATGGFREDTVYDDYEWWLRLSVKHEFRFAQVHEFLFNYNRKQGSRVSILDQRKEEGFAQLNREYGKVCE